MSDEILVIEDENEEDVFGDLQTLEDDSEVVEDDITDEDGSETEEHNVVTNDDGTRTLFLKYPVTFKVKGRDNQITPKTYDQVTFRRISGADYRVIGDIKSEMEQTFTLLQRLAVNVPKPFFDKIDGVDFEGCQVAIEHFLSKSQRIGSKS